LKQQVDFIAHHTIILPVHNFVHGWRGNDFPQFCKEMLCMNHHWVHKNIQKIRTKTMNQASACASLAYLEKQQMNLHMVGLCWAHVQMDMHLSHTTIASTSTWIQAGALKQVKHLTTLSLASDQHHWPDIGANFTKASLYKLVAGHMTKLVMHLNITHS
jgi:hypothetical protein